MTNPIATELTEPYRQRPDDGYSSGLHCPLLAAPHRGSRLVESRTPEQIQADRQAIITGPRRMDPDSSRYGDDGEGS